MIHGTAIDRYSSVVTLQLIVNGQFYPLAQIGPDFVSLKTASILPSGPATIVMEVDGDERRWEVILQESEGPVEIIRTRAA